MKIPELRRIALARQGLLSAKAFGKGLSGAGKAIEHLGYLQIDTLSVVERAHHHVLWSRVPGYTPEHLNQLVTEKRLFEYWFHAASYIPTRDYRFALPQMHAVRKGENRYFRGADMVLMKKILQRAGSEGALRLRDIEKSTKPEKELWWNSGPGRKALAQLFMQGDLMISARRGMEKIYDLPERCLPSDIDTRFPSALECARYLLEFACRAHGVFTWKQLLHLRTDATLKAAMQALLKERLNAGEIVEVKSDRLPTFYIESSIRHRKSNNKDKLCVLSPFDNSLIHRERLAALFDFDYKMECYVAAPKRLYGYFCLPILFGEKFVARMDCKAHRNDQRLEILSLHLEQCTFDRDRFFYSLEKELRRFAQFNSCVVVDTAKLRSVWPCDLAC